MIIFLADDHHIVAKGISSLLAEIKGVTSIQIFQHGKTLIQEFNYTKPDFIFLDVEMPIMDGKETLKAIKKIYPSVPCCMLSMLTEKSVIETCIQLGARGFINKNCTVEELKDAILEIKQGEIYYSNEILKYLSGVKQPESHHLLKEPLSEREMEILRFLCDGFSPREIADLLFVSHRTIETHKNNIMQKFNVNSVTKLVSVALKNKFV
jgi:DNA-binding NarL/FixJ family response regulator